MGKSRKQSKTDKRVTPKSEIRAEEIFPAAPEVETNKQPKAETGRKASKPDEIDLLWRYGSWLILGVAAVLRFAYLTYKPFHHDEGVNGFFLTGLFRDGNYKYDPTNYHGPSLYYFALVSSWIFGLDDLAVRIVVAVFGLLTVALVFSLRRYLGTVGTLTAAALVAVSPGLTFFSRYFIHEILLVFFTLACAVCILKFIERERANIFAIASIAVTLFICILPFGLRAAAATGTTDQTQLYALRFIAVATAAGLVIFTVRRLMAWNDGRPIYILLAAASASMTFTTKETSFISLGTMLIAAGSVWVWTWLNTDPASGLRNRQIGFAAIGAGIVIAAVYFYADLSSGIGIFFDNYFLNVQKREQPLVFVLIAALFVAMLEAVRRYLYQNWNRTDIGSGTSADMDAVFLKESISLVDNLSGLVFLGIITFALVSVVFFSSFFTYENGISAAFEAYNIWTKTGSTDHASNGTWAYLKWLAGAEGPILILGFLGTVIAFWKATHRFAMFAGLWGFGLFAAYTIIPYKTPWIAINFVLPMALVAGYAINELAGERDRWLRMAAKIFAGTALVICLFQCIELNFFRYDDDRRPYVYVHSMRGMNEMIGKIEHIAKVSRKGEQTKIIITSPENWPLPWSLNQYKGAAFFGSVVKTPDAEAVIGQTTQRETLDKEYSATHVVTGTYALRPGVDLLLYIRKDLAGN